MNIADTTILIVEDNDLNRRLYQQALAHEGFSTVVAECGREVLSLARHHRPAVILMDIQLPEVSGMEATRWLKADQSLRDIPVIAVSAFAMEREKAAIMAAGCDAYLSKPVGIFELLQTIRSHLAPPA